MDKWSTLFIGDVFYESLSDSAKIELHKKFDQCGSVYLAAGTVGGKWHGAISDCPKCVAARFTDRCACMCGKCYTCGYTWVCMPIVCMPINIFAKEEVYSAIDYTI